MSGYKNEHKPYGPYEKYFKRPLDIIFSLLALVILSPVLLVVAILVRIKLGSPIIFKQERPGKDEKIFRLYKFRTMTDEKDKKGKLLPDEKRLTKFGKLLRSTSLDELPELFNILKGDMSFIGPRPLLIEYVPYYTYTEHKRHDIRPGLTGLAQINGRSLLSWQKRFKTDLKYVNNITIKNDLIITIKTINKVIFRQDITTSGNLSFKNLNTERPSPKRLIETIIIDKQEFNKYRDDIYECFLHLKSNKRKAKQLTKKMQSFIDDGTAIVYGAILNNKLISFIWGYEIKDSTIHVNYFSTNKAYRGIGAGTKLLDKYIDANQKYELIVEKNNPAIKLYEKYGFKKKQFLDNKYKMVTE